MIVAGIDLVLQRMSELGYALVAVQNELRHVKWDLGEIKATNSTPNTNNCQTNVHVLQPDNLPMPQHPPVSYTDKIHNNPPSQASVDQRLPGSDVVESVCEVVVNGGNSNIFCQSNPYDRYDRFWFSDNSRHYWCYSHCPWREQGRMDGYGYYWCNEKTVQIKLLKFSCLLVCWSRGKDHTDTPLILLIVLKYTFFDAIHVHVYHLIRINYRASTYFVFISKTTFSVCLKYSS